MPAWPWGKVDAVNGFGCGPAVMGAFRQKGDHEVLKELKREHERLRTAMFKLQPELSVGGLKEALHEYELALGLSDAMDAASAARFWYCERRRQRQNESPVVWQSCCRQSTFSSWLDSRLSSKNPCMTAMRRCRAGARALACCPGHCLPGALAAIASKGSRAEEPEAPPGPCRPRHLRRRPAATLLVRLSQ